MLGFTPGGLISVEGGVFRMEPVSKTVFLPKPRGFCAGVIRAIDIVRIALEELGRPVYVRKEIVHNRFVVDELAAQGAVFVENLDEVPDGAVTIFSAHGVAPEVWQEARRRGLRVIDATCPLVTKVHIEVIRYARENYSIILIGHPNHDEVIGTYGEAPDAIHLVSSVADVDAPASSDICYATQNRQTAVKVLADRADLILVVGAQNSSNSNRLVEVAQSAGTAAYLIASVLDIRGEWLEGCRSIGVTAGASTPENLVQHVVENLRLRGFRRVEELEIIEENVHFPLPAPLEKFDRVVS